MNRWVGVVVVVALAVVAFVAWPGRRADPRTPHLLDAHARPPQVLRLSGEQRLDALRRARLWRPPASRIRIALTPEPDPRLVSRETPLECRHEPSTPHGTTSKFDCVLADGEVVKVKYGTTPEIQAEAAASRLLAFAGFGADSVSLVPLLHCYGCPRRPFEASQAAERLPLGQTLLRGFSRDRYTAFEWVAVERRFTAATIESDTAEGWGWFELQQLPAEDESQRAERDALALMALLLAHWDNKPDNQRLVCLDRAASVPARGCTRPFALIHDLGATFGPLKVDLARWTAAPIWSDPFSCRVDMRHLPYGGGTFTPAHVGEDGRQLLLRELERLTAGDIREWFEGARFAEADAWTRAFTDKVAQIAAGGPCPAPD